MEGDACGKRDPLEICLAGAIKFADGAMGKCSWARVRAMEEEHPVAEFLRARGGGAISTDAPAMFIRSLERGIYRNAWRILDDRGRRRRCARVAERDGFGLRVRRWV